MRAKVLRKQRESNQQQNNNNQNVVINIYKVELTDIEKRGYLMLKHFKSRNFKLQESCQYLLDRVKLSINRKGDLIVSSTSATVIREEKEDTFTVESIELSQRFDEEEMKGGDPTVSCFYDEAAH